MSDDGGGSGDPLQRAMAITAVALLVALAVTWVVGAALGGRLAGQPGLALALRLKVLVTTFNVVLLGVLSATYLGLYRDLPNRFTRSLVLFTVALLLYALTANPFVALVFGFRPRVGLGPFTFIPDLFAAVAIVILLHQSFQ